MFTKCPRFIQANASALRYEAALSRAHNKLHLISASGIKVYIYNQTAPYRRGVVIFKKGFQRLHLVNISMRFRQ